MSFTLLNLYQNTEENVSECPICEGVFSENNQFLKHLSLHTKNNLPPEIIGGRTENDKKVVQKLILNSEEISIACPICDEMFLSHKDLELHLSLHAKDVIISCGLCRAVFKEPSELKKHLLTHNEKESINSTNFDPMIESNNHIESVKLKEQHNHTSFHHETSLSPICDSTIKDNVKSIHKLNQHYLPGAEENKLPCPICCDVFNQPLELESHLLIHAEKMSVTCPICEVIFIKPTQLKIHLMTHADLVPIKCQTCGTLFEEPGMLQLHLLTHSEKGFMSCTLCSLKFDNLTELIMHLVIHTERLAISCPICEDKYVNPTKLKLHLMLHAHETALPCYCCSNENGLTPASNRNSLLCNKSYFTIKEFSELNVHISPPIDRNTFKKYFKMHLTCDICSYKCDSDSQLLTHWNIHFKNIFFCMHCCEYYSEMELINSVNFSMTTFKCPVCDKALFKNWKCTDCSVSNENTRTMKKCSIEIITTPKNSKPGILNANILKCAFCNKKSFAHKFHLKQHLSLHLNKVFTCTLCYVKYPDIVTLTTHALFKHSEVEFLECLMCDKELKKNKHTFMSHLKSHTFIKQFKCPDCTQTFTDKWKLKSHSHRSHPKEIEYQCRYCSKWYKRREDMRFCLRAHEGRRPFKCIFCSAAFMSKSQLKSHNLEQHSDEKIFKCINCRCAYSSLDELKSHSKMNHHKRSIFVCDLCGYTVDIKVALRNHMIQVHLST